jgi:DEAD/DEAH box helicase domain-containing protein
MRRLQRLCYYLGAQPTFICASATIKNPGELARALTSQRHTVIGQDRDGSPRRLRRFVLWDSTKSEEAINTDASTLMAALVGEHRVKTITFGHSIPSVDAIYRYVNGRLQDLFGQRVELIKEFKRALMPDDKRAIARRLREGQLHGVVTTTALKMGIDIGDLSAALIIKYPGSIADVWQQAGRAGRKGEGLIVLMADRDPLNQYFATNPDDFFAMEPEEVFVDPDNKYIILDQLWCAIKDWELNEAIDKRFFGENLPEYLTLLDNEGKVRREAARDAWVLRDKDGTPAREVPIRSMGFSFNVIDDRGNVVAREDAVRAARYLHKFARYPVQDDVFEVIAFDLDLHRRQGSAKVRRVARPVEFLTSSVTRSETTINRTGMQRQSFGASLSFGEITFSSQVYAYYRVPTGGRGDRQARAEFQPLGPAAPPERVFETTASWLTIPARCITEHDEQEFTAGLRSMARALATAVTIQEFCDPADIGGLEVVREPISGQPMIFLHDTVPGGIGIAEQTYYDFENVFRRAYRILNECPNAANNPDHRGCPRCVTEAWGDESVVNRPVALAIMRAMLGDDPVVVRHSDEEIVTILTQNGFANVAYVRPGGMGRIYRAERGGRTLAVKVINPMTQRLSSEAQERMAREASIWKRLVHQNIVPLHEVNQPNGLFYLTMDWMSRGSLRDRLPAAGLAPRESVRIALGVARALTHLAHAEFVHRDVKPDNILFDTADQPRLTDFGIAKSVDDDVGVKTRSGLWMGTPGYVPPEQLRDSASCTARTDVFALGVVLYEMLTGVLPGRDTVGGVPPKELNRIGIVALADLLRRMLVEEQSMRPRAAEVVRLLEEITL